MDILTISDVNDDIISIPECVTTNKSDAVSSTTADLNKTDEDLSSRREKRSSDRDQAKSNKARSPRRSRSPSRSHSYSSRRRLRTRRRVRSSTSPIHGLVKLIWNRNKTRSSALNRSPTSSSSSSSSPPRSRRKCISPTLSASRSRSRSPPAQNHNRLPSVPKEKADKKNPVVIEQEKAPAEEIKDEKPALPSVVVRPAEQNKKLCSVQNAVRCRDFDERGLCMRGERCPYDHGQDPVVLEDISLLDHINVQPPAFKQDFPQHVLSTSRQMGPWYPRTAGEYYPENPGVEARVGWLGVQPPHFRNVNMGSRYRPGLLPRPLGPFQIAAHPRELINVSVMDHSSPNHISYGLRGPHQVHQPMGRDRDVNCGRGRFGFDHGRLGPKPVKQFTNCSLEIKKIPREQNNIMDLNKYFLRFGKILNIQVRFKNDPEAALVTFSNPMEAQAAYRCTEAVLNNRFVRLFWHKNGKENEETENVTRVVLKEPCVPVATCAPVATEETEKDEQEVPGSDTEKDFCEEARLQKEAEIVNKANAVEAIKRSQEMLAAEQTIIRLQEEKKKDSLKLLADLVNRKKKLVEEQIEQQKKLIAKLETNKSSMKPEEREQIMTIIKALQQSIESIKEGM